jgi:hypothetical protein
VSKKRDVLGQLTSCLTPQLDRCAKAALRGDRDATAELLDHASLATYVLEQIASNDPDALKSLARRAERWPVLIGVHPEDVQSAQATVKSLELGLNAPLSPKIRKGKGWSKKTSANEFVLRYIKRMKGARHVHGSLKRQLGDVPPQYSEHLTAEILALPELSAATADRWFETMWSVILASYPGMHPKRQSALRLLGQYRAKHNEATKTKRTTEANIRDGIKTSLRNSFRRIIPTSSPNIARKRRGS